MVKRSHQWRYKRYESLGAKNVEFVRLQFRRPGTGEWISAWNAGTTDSADLQCSNARGEGCSFEWDLENQYFLNSLKDGPWEIRAKVFCSGYDSFATADVRGSVTDDTLYMIADVAESHDMRGVSRKKSRVHNLTPKFLLILLQDLPIVMATPSQMVP